MRRYSGIPALNPPLNEEIARWNACWKVGTPGAALGTSGDAIGVLKAQLAMAGARALLLAPLVACSEPVEVPEPTAAVQGSHSQPIADRRNAGSSLTCA